MSKLSNLSKYNINPITVNNVIENLSISHNKHNILSPLDKPIYDGPTIDSRVKLGLAVKSMENHTSNEGLEIFRGLESNGYTLAGHNLSINITDVNLLIKRYNPGTVVIQDRREYEGKTANSIGGLRFNHDEKFTNVVALSQNSEIFKLTIIKDAHQDNGYHAHSAKEIGCNGWICYYNPLIVHHLAPYTRFDNLVRTYHSINKDMVPIFSLGNRNGCLLSGASSTAYPLRLRLIKELSQLYQTTYLPHPGYVRNKCYTPEFLKILSRFKVSICTSSMFGYMLRKIPESTACGCIVITDLPIDERVPYIDDNLVRVHPNTSTKDISILIKDLVENYDEERQRYYSELAKKHYDYREITRILVEDIEKLRLNYNATNDSRKSSTI